MAQESAKALTSSLGKLQISQKEKASKKDKVADSWEDDVEEDDGDSTPVRPSTSASDIPGPPPPTPSSPTAAREQTTHFQSFPPFEEASPSSIARSSTRVGGEERRPDKTTSVASRLIAAGIGQKAPKRTQEQREYDQAMKVQEKKKRDEAKAEEERKKREKEQAQKDIWGD